MTSSTIPNRQVFRAQEVCEIAQVQPYVLKSWEAEFPDLGMAKTAKGQRVYRRGDVERVLQLKDLLFKEGLTLAGARKRLAEQGPVANTDDPVDDDDVAALLDEEVRQHLRDVRRGLQWVLGVLDGDGVAPEDFVLMADSDREGRAGTRRPSKSARSAPKAPLTKAGRVAGKRPASSGKSSARSTASARKKSAPRKRR